MSAPTPASSSIITTANIASTNEDDDNENIQVDKWPSVNDVVAVKSNESIFKLGKINEIKQNHIIISLFQYKLDKKTEQISPQDILLNFGGNSTKSTFVFSVKKQKALVNKIIEIDANCDSFVRIINDVKEKTELVLNMESKIESMLEKIILTDDHSELINELVNDKSIELNKMMSCILNHISNIQNQIHIQQLAQIIARQCFKKKSLGDIGPYVNSMIDNEENSLKKTFIKKVLMEISRLTRQNKPVGYDPIVDDFLGLSSIVMSWTLQRIAIIGAGAAGSSAAFFLNKQLSILACRDKVEITIYEKETRVGGRAAIIHPYNDPKYNPVEIGASIYASVNLHMKRAIEQFNLSPKFLDIDNTHNTYLYNGKTVLVDMDDPTTRYNPVSLMRMNSLAQATVQRFLQLYQRRFQLLKGPFRTVEAYAKAIDLEPRVNESGFEFLTRNGLDTMIVNELVDSTTQGTYGQQVTQLHAVMTFVAMVGRGNSIVGGNYQIFGM
ncbi:unnamed protein product [Rotaria magnacalcarata]|uniref:Prenylcysteine lyase domain-containing protein n=1 Tax=Rotaria magnacalcarata TaxID=392030 RepID=A0A815Z084_9BILA|nr:unnamed protein product [Rotaria magnacalcarata]